MTVFINASICGGVVSLSSISSLATVSYPINSLDQNGTTTIIIILESTRSMGVWIVSNREEGFPVGFVRPRAVDAAFFVAIRTEIHVPEKP